MPSFRRPVPVFIPTLRSHLAVAALGLFAVVTFPAADARASDPAPQAGGLTDDEIDQKAADLSNEVMSPFCPGRTLASCPSPNATAWREEIRTWLRQGDTPQEIRKRLEKRAGRNLSGAPEGSMSWGLPVGIGLGSVIFLALAASRLLRRDEDNAVPPKPAKTSSDPSNDGDDALDARLDEELEKLDIERDE